MTQITLQFDLDRNIDAAAQDVQAAINAAGGSLPKNLPNPPTYEKSNPADFTILSLALTSDTLPLTEVDRYAEDFIAPQVAQMRGVGLVDFHGQLRPAVRVRLDPDRLAELDLTLEDVRAAIGTQTLNAPKGTLGGPHQSIVLNATDQLMRADAYKVAGHRLSQRRADPAVGRRHRGGCAGGHPRGGVVCRTSAPSSSTFTSCPDSTSSIRSGGSRTGCRR